MRKSLVDCCRMISKAKWNEGEQKNKCCYFYIVFFVYSQRISELYLEDFYQEWVGVFYPTDSPVPLTRGRDSALSRRGYSTFITTAGEKCQRKNSHCSGLWVTELQAQSCFRCVRHTRQAWEGGGGRGWVFLGGAGHSQRALPHPALRQVKPLNIVHRVNCDCLARGFRSAECTSAWAEMSKVFTGATMVRYLVYFLLY